MQPKSQLPAILNDSVDAAFGYLATDLVAPGAAAAMSVVGKYLLRRFNETREVVRSELRHTGATKEDFEDADQFAAGALRLARAARDQVADENIRLLVQAMAGLARRQKLWADDFLKYADILASLSHDEIVVIGAFMTEDARKLSYAVLSSNQNGLMGPLWHKLVEPVGRGIFQSPDHLLAVVTRAQRSGLIIAVAAGGSGGGMLNALDYKLSPMGREMRTFLNVEAVLNLGLRPEQPS